MNTLRYKDATYAPSISGYTWSWASLGLSFEHHERDESAWTGLRYGDALVWDCDGHVELADHWNDVSGALLNHDIICEPMNTKVVDIPLPLEQ